MSKTVTRTPPPRQLGNKETLESLLHWKTAFKTFYKRDDSYKIFFKPNTVWNFNSPNYGFVEDDEDGRSPEDISEDLKCRSEKFGRGLREIGVEAKQRVVMFAETRSVLDFDSELIC